MREFQQEQSTDLFLNLIMFLKFTSVGKNLEKNTIRSSFFSCCSLVKRNIKLHDKKG